MSGINTPQQIAYQGQYSIVTRAFNFTNFGQVIAGGTLSSPEIFYTPFDSTLNIEGTTINSDIFYDYEGGGSIQPGKGVIAQFSGGTPGTTYTLYCRVQVSPVDGLSEGDTVEIQSQLQIITSSSL